MIDPSIALQTKVFEPPDPVERYGRVLALQNALQQNRAGALQLQQQEQEIEDQQKLRKAYSEAGGDLEKTEKNAVALGVSPNTLMKVKQQLLEQRAKWADIDEKELKVKKEHTEAIGAAAQSILSLPPEARPNAYAQARQQLIAAGRIKPAEAPEQYPGAEGLQQIANSSRTAQQLIESAFEDREVKAREATAKATTDKTQAEKDTRWLNAAAGVQSQQELDAIRAQAKQDGATVGAINRIPQMFSPTAMQSFGRTLMTQQERVQADQAKANADETKRYRDKELENSAARLGIERARLYQDREETKLTPEALDKMSEMFATTGQLPAMGMGRASSLIRSQIINRAAKKYPNVQFATQKAEFQANEASLKAIQKTADATDAFESTAGKNIDVFLKTAQGIVDTGSPLLNKPVRALAGTMFGAKSMAAFKTARETALTEAAKVLESPQGGGALTVSGREAIKTLSNEDATLGQQVEAMRILRNDMANRKESYRQQIDAIKTRIGGKQETAPKGGAPAIPEVGGIFNGGKVLKVEQISK